MKPRAYKFDTRVYADIPVVRCLDSHYHTDCAGDLADALQGALNRRPTGPSEGGDGKAVVLDMSGVRLFSSSALRAVRAAHVEASKSGRRIVAAGGGEMAVNVLKFAPFILHFETVALALAHFSDDAARAFANVEG